MLIDTHCHLDFPEYDIDRDEVIRRSLEQGIGYIINVGSSLENSIRAKELAVKYESIFACVGCHPHDADDFSPDMLNRLKDLVSNKKVKAIGEVGLDYFRNLSTKENQKKAFLSLINLAKGSNLPLVVHSRQAQEDTLAILKTQMVSKAIVHCFSGDEQFLNDCLRLGYYVSFTCNITYKKSDKLRKIVKITPMDRICLETDGPYLSPEGLRGKRNEPVNVRFVAEEIARIKGISVDEVAKATTANAKLFFNIK
ncbi:MAG: TatD family hydrolase [Candidatus Omnitrophota bacterium]|nr:TatD family hydrolase [Candidatus Omnitrophota bacterium]MBU1928594.1 TatD family hydrolase [Candidatus Omnitrophota bacterium]MBU2034607.1 TatD family hydrolase [Candidatus Omnitrophota bacterium]MBU2221978.1 TatD family hydrolase [Candidatus Omnitrophota bacterium]MBU2258692.1 TatD family hydrolase [Candidatus Omnitrophota bacterium]